MPKTVAVGKTLTLYGAYTPVRAALTSDFDWSSSDTSIATVDENGLVTFVGTGAVTIELGFSSVALFAYTDEVTFTVVEQSELPVTDFTISGDTSVAEGSTIQLAIDGLTPEGAYTCDLVWTSSDPTIAIIDQNGVVTGLDGGSGLTYSKTVTISATIGGITKTLDVKVTRGLLNSTISGVEISGDSATGIGNSITFSSTVTPSRLSGNSDVVISWGLVNPVTNEKIYATSDTPANDGISSMTSSGVLTGIADGTSTVFVEATYNGTSVTDTQTVTVGTAITDFTISGTAEINEGATTQLSIADITPSDAVYEKIIWTSADPSIASVDENGLVKGLDAGGNYSLTNNPSQSTTITATINGVSRSFTVKVKAKFGLNAYTGGYISGPDTLIVDLPYTYTSTHTPTRMDVYKQTWGVDSSISSTENDYVSVDTSTGAVTGKMAGITEIFTYMQNNLLGSSKQTLSKTIDVIELVPKSITITNPTKYDYLEGDTELDLTGMVVKVTYDKTEVAQYYPGAESWTDEQLSATITDYTVSEINTTLLDNEQYIIVTVTRAGKSLRAIFPILVSSKQVDTIEITEYPQYQYVEGATELNLDGLKVMANYLNADSEEVTGYNVNTSKFDTTLFNVEQNITVSYTHAGRTAETSFPVIVYGIPVVSVATVPSDYTGEWTSDDVVFTLDATNQVDGITYYYRTGNSADWTELSANTLTVDTSIEETYYFKAINGKNIESAETVGYIVSIDKVVPAFSLTPETTDLTNEAYNVNIEIGGIGASGVRSITLDGNDITGQTAFEVSQNGTHTVTVLSNSGLSSTQEIIINNIDKANPVVNSIVVDAVNSGDNSGLDNQFGSCFKGEAEAVISAEDFGIAGLEKIEYRFVDADGNALGEWTLYEDDSKPTVNTQFKGYVEAIATDNAGNVSEVYRSQGFTVDCEKPESVAVTATDGDGEYADGRWTANNVELTLSSTAFSGIYMYYYSIDDGETWYQVDNNTIIASKHGVTTYLLKAMSYSGLESDITVFTVSIDKVAPVVRVDIEGVFGKWTAEAVTFNLSTLNEAISGVTYYYSTDGEEWTEVTDDNSLVIMENTVAYYSFKAENGAGVVSNPSDSYKVMIDTTVPAIELTPETTEYAKEAFDINFTVYCGDSGLKSVMVNGEDVTGESKYTVNGNGIYVFVVTGNNGISVTKSITIENYDKDVPTVTGIDLGEYVNVVDGVKLYNNDATIAIFTSDMGNSGVAKVEYRLLDETMSPVTEWVDYDENNKPVINANFKGYVEARATDTAGNTSSYISELFLIDNTTPDFEVTADITAITNEQVVITLNIIDSGLCGVAEATVNGEMLDGAEYVATENGAYRFTVALNNGKSVTKTVAVTNIDKASPVITGISTGDYASKINGVAIYGTEPELTITASDNVAIAKIEYQLGDGEWLEYDENDKPTIPNDFNGTVKARATDVAGNVSEIVDGSCIMVDTDKPEITVTAESNELWDTVTVTYTLSGDADSGIAYYMTKVENGNWVILDGVTYTVSGDKAQNCYFKAVSNAGIESDAVVQITDASTASFSIKTPSRTAIRCNDGIKLHIEMTGNIPEGTRIEWIANNGNFTISQSDDGSTLTIVSKNNGTTTFTAILYDADGNVLGIDTVEMTSNASFGQKIGGFFRSLFGSTTIYEN